MEAMSERSDARILIVEDEGIIAHNIERMLNRMGYSVAGICRSSDEVIPTIIQEQPSVVLMDIRIEGPQDGVTMAERIRDLCSIPVVYLTALMDDETLERAKITQPFGYIAKPFSQRELEITLEIALYKSRMEQRLARQDIQIQRLIENIHQGFCLIDPEGCIQYANKQFGVLVGTAPSSLVGKAADCFICLPQDRQDGCHHAWINDEPFETELHSCLGRSLKVIVTAQHLNGKGQNGGCFISVTDAEAVVRQDAGASS